MKNALPLAAAVSLATLLSACATTQTAGPSATARLEGRSGTQVAGTVSFRQEGQLVRVEAQVRGLTPGEHGFHIHEAGDCSAPDASSAKGHFNPGNKPHGRHGEMSHHAGDMPNLVADAYGNAAFAGTLTQVSVSSGPDGIVGRSVVIHADPDDYKSQPAGNSGKRVACGVIGGL
ncbi:MAG TPA: superoxide dismutase family protein [Rhodocyclaceae bacterium]|nr:superoxide dismutase family protein [Rhodocyclaceae bacterium]HNH36317.1 superoxide dismutase family protein [Rhodocyclaceae bacterium]